MTDLKTLKDLINEAEEKEGKIQCCRDCQIDNFFNILEQEAIKWVKGWQNTKNELEREFNIPCVAAFKVFFNLTEKDLKE